MGIGLRAFRAFIGIVFILAAASGARAAALASITINGANGNAIGTMAVASNTTAPNVNNGDISDVFTIGNTFTMATAAAAANAGHFNYLNIVVGGTGPGAGADAQTKANTPQDPSVVAATHIAFPWVDPTSGGNSGFGFAPQPADTFPFYYGETTDVAVDEIPIGPQTTATTVKYFDHPNNLAGISWDFQTYLVGVPGAVGQTTNKTFDILGGFSWTFTESNPAATESISNLAAIANPDLTTLNTTLAAARNFPGWSAVPLPEPAGAGLLAVAGLLQSRRRARRDRGRKHR